MNTNEFWFCENKGKTISSLKKKWIGTGVYYPVPIHLQKAYEKLDYVEGGMPVAKCLSRRTLAISIYQELSLEQK
ncbi:DegT/DnrJ/EryC1/StrS family aminotransferase [Clostridium beijerinckii]|uniref:DegT/DnrJ/EryC1/StrS family aminotransferase n=1 Tax=Clostridium beijerinckii TaxID=1520 RepID=UPI00241898DC|nr:DegT/DnrJ/EryC1/StrS family aminotransferase [Clostridium beijerinckii]